MLNVNGPVLPVEANLDRGNVVGIWSGLRAKISDVWVIINQVTSVIPKVEYI